MVLSRVVREGLTDKVAFEEECEGDNRVTYADVWERAFLARDSRCRAVGWECDLHVGGIARRPVCLEQNES